MNIAIVGPEKYKFQDLVCLDLALSLGASGVRSMVPEPFGGEDTVFEWAAGDAVRFLEVQVKGTSDDLTVAALAEYLTHYPERIATGSLLERLADDEDRAVLFVISGRIADAIASFRVNRNLETPPKTHSVGKQLLPAFVAELSRLASAKPASDLDAKRRADIARLANFSPMKLRGALSKVFVISEEIQATVETRMHGRLRAMRFDTLSLRGTIAALTDELDEAKKSQANVLTALHRRLDELAPAAIAPSTYVELGVETNLREALRDQGVLLLTGPPRAGKTWVQRALGGSLQTAGYEVREGISVDEAERFLTDAAGGERLFLLDDPFGSREASEKARAHFADLVRLIERLRPGRLLIVAQIDHVLFEVCRTSKLTNCAVGKRGWTPVLPIAVDKAREIWAASAAGMKLADTTTARVDALVSSDDRLRSPGALTYLAHAFSDLPDTVSDDAIAVFAHGDASDFARILVEKNPAIEPMLVAAAIGTRPDKGIFRTDLAFVMNGGDDAPGLTPRWGIINMGGAAPELPSYSSPPDLTTDQISAHDLLARRRVIEETEQRTNFPHPYLRAGAQMLLVPDLMGDREVTRARLIRGIGSLSPDASLSVARNLGWIRAMLDTGSDDFVAFAVAEHGLRSIFPATRDACFSFLMEHVASLPSEMRDQVPQWAEHGISDLDNIFVDRGVAFLSSRAWSFRSDKIALPEVQPYLDAINEDRTLGLDLPLSRQILTALRDHPLAMTPKIVERFLRADEALIRAEASRIWVCVDRVDDEAILDRIREDTAPAVGVAVFEALADAWSGIGEARRDVLLAIVERQARSTATASVLFSRLVLFNREDEFGAKPPWAMFVKLVPTVLDRLPANIDLNSGRFNSALDSAIAVGLKRELLPVVVAWTRRSIRRLRHYSLDDYELAMVEPLVEVANVAERSALLGQLLLIEDTGARTVIAADIADSWEKFDPGERSRILSWFNEARPDRRWIQAVLLTRRALNPEVLMALVGRESITNLPVTALEELLGDDLLEACVRTFVGQPQPLWWYGKHHSNGTLWEPIIRSLATDPAHALFDAAFSNVFSFDHEDAIERTVNAIPADGLWRTFELMLMNKIRTTGEWHCGAWVSLFDRAELAGVLDDWLAIIDGKLDAILSGYPDIRRWLASSRYAERIAALLPTDFGVLVTLVRAEQYLETIQSDNAGGDESVPYLAAKIALAEAVAAEAVQNPPRLMDSWSTVGNFGKDAGAGEAILKRVEEKRLAAVDRHHDLRKSERDYCDGIELRGWIDTARRARMARDDLGQPADEPDHDID